MHAHGTSANLVHVLEIEVNQPASLGKDVSVQVVTQKPEQRLSGIGVAHHHVCTDIGARLRTLAQSGLGAYNESAGQVLLPSTNSGSLGGIVTGTTQVRRS